MNPSGINRRQFLESFRAGCRRGRRRRIGRHHARRPERRLGHDARGDPGRAGADAAAGAARDLPARGAGRSVLRPGGRGPRWRRQGRSGGRRHAQGRRRRRSIRPGRSRSSSCPRATSAARSRRSPPTAFFQTIRFKTIAVLYNNPLVWQAFGYEGEAFEYGGYIERGFDDLGWLPDPPDDASPPVEL